MRLVPIQENFVNQTSLERQLPGKVRGTEPRAVPMSSSDKFLGELRTYDKFCSLASVEEEGPLFVAVEGVVCTFLSFLLAEASMAEPRSCL